VANAKAPVNPFDYSFVTKKKKKKACKLLYFHFPLMAAAFVDYVTNAAVFIL